LGYTLTSTGWDVADDIMDILDSVQYYINGKLFSSGPDASLEGAHFRVCTSEIMVIGFLEDLVDTCYFKVTINRVCPDTVVDVEGNVYVVTPLSGKCWSAYLNSTLYSDSTAVAFAKPYNSLAYPDAALNRSIFGLLYTWYSAVGLPEGSTALPQPDQYGFVQGICPEGWHLPSQAELALLQAYPSVELRSELHWTTPPGPGTDDYGFDARGSGWFDGKIGWFKDLYGFTGYWSYDSEPGSQFAHYFYLANYCEDGRTDTTNKFDGMSVRCILDDHCEE